MDSGVETAYDVLLYGQGSRFVAEVRNTLTGQIAQLRADSPLPAGGAVSLVGWRSRNGIAVIQADAGSALGGGGRATDDCTPSPPLQAGPTCGRGAGAFSACRRLDVVITIPPVTMLSSRLKFSIRPPGLTLACSPKHFHWRRAAKLGGPLDERAALSIERAIENNRAWAASAGRSAVLSRLAAGQRPEMLYIGCSDSRITAEDLAGRAGPGLRPSQHRQRPAGYRSNALSVIEFAIVHLSVKQDRGLSGTTSVVAIGRRCSLAISGYSTPGCATSATSIAPISTSGPASVTNRPLPPPRRAQRRRAVRERDQDRPPSSDLLRGEPQVCMAASSMSPACSKNLNPELRRKLRAHSQRLRPGHEPATGPRLRRRCVAAADRPEAAQRGSFLPPPSTRSRRHNGRGPAMGGTTQTAPALPHCSGGRDSNPRPGG